MLLRTLLERVVDEYPSAPEVMALRALVDSVKEFCTRTHIWQETLAAPLRAADSAKFVLVPGAGRVVAAPKSVKVDGRSLDPVALDDRRMTRTAYPGAVPRVYTQWSPGMIELDVAPPAGAIVTVKAALTLATDADDGTDIPGDIINEYGESIAAGAKMRLVRMANQPWTNPQLGVLYAGIYYNDISTAKRRTTSALGQAELRVEMVPFA